MAGEIFSVGLDIKNEQLRGEFEEIIALQSEFRLQKPGEPKLPQIIIMEIEEDRLKTFSRMNIITDTSPVTEIFLTAPSTDSEILLAALRAGVKEFIPYPVKVAELEYALKRFKARHRESRLEQAKQGKLITVMGSKGGVGTTTIAINLAISLQELHKNSSVVLIDLNSQFGDTALFLNIEPTYTWADIVKNLSRLDDTFLLSTLSRHPSGLYLLPAVNTVEEMGVVTPESAEITLDLLQASFDYVVVDSGHMLDDITMTVLKAAPTILLISTLTLPVLRNTRRLLDLFPDLGYADEDIKIILNRSRAKKEVSLKDFEEVVERKVFWSIPNDYTRTLSAINTGRPVAAIAHRAKITKSFHKLALALAIEAQEETKSSFLRRLFKPR